MRLLFGLRCCHRRRSVCLQADDTRLWVCVVTLRSVERRARPAAGLPAGVVTPCSFVAQPRSEPQP